MPNMADPASLQLQESAAAARAAVAANAELLERSRRRLMTPELPPLEAPPNAELLQRLRRKLLALQLPRFLHVQHGSSPIGVGP